MKILSLFIYCIYILFNPDTSVDAQGDIAKCLEGVMWFQKNIAIVIYKLVLIYFVIYGD